jgi:hypothetical protein
LLNLFSFDGTALVPLSGKGGRIALDKLRELSVGCGKLQETGPRAAAVPTYRSGYLRSRGIHVSGSKNGFIPKRVRKGLPQNPINPTQGGPPCNAYSA